MMEKYILPNNGMVAQIKNQYTGKRLHSENSSDYKRKLLSSSIKYLQNKQITKEPEPKLQTVNNHNIPVQRSGDEITENIHGNTSYFQEITKENYREELASKLSNLLNSGFGSISNEDKKKSIKLLNLCEPTDQIFNNLNIVSPELVYFILNGGSTSLEKETSTANLCEPENQTLNNLNVSSPKSGVANKEYEIESILYDDIFDNQTKYFIKWKNYPMDQCTWEPSCNLTKCQELLNNYISNKTAKKNIRTTDKFKRLYESLLSHTNQEYIKTLHKIIADGFPSLDKESVLSTIEYLSTVSPSSQSKCLMKLVRHNLMLVEVSERRQKQLEKLDDWQKTMNITCNFNLSVLNTVDFEGPPNNFVYINECFAGEGVIIPNDPPVWCYCDNTCGGKASKNKNCHFSDFPLPYNKKKCIIVPQGSTIYECNKKCACDSNCINRVVQHGPSKNLNLQIFRTDNQRGWGVKTLMPIQQGSFVSKYTGEIITKVEADQRAVTHESKSTYMFDLDFYTEKNDCAYSIDATTFGNVSHFFNHSCDANLASYAVCIDCYDSNLPTLAFFASKEIAKGEELTLNYMTSVTNQKSKVKCYCQADNCRGFLC